MTQKSRSNLFKTSIATLAALALGACGGSDNDDPAPVAELAPDASVFTITELDLPADFSAAVFSTNLTVEATDFSLLNASAFDPAIQGPAGVDAIEFDCGTNGDGQGTETEDGFLLCDITFDTETQDTIISVSEPSQLVLTFDLTRFVEASDIDTGTDGATTVLSTFLYPTVSTISIASTSTVERFSFAVLGNPAIDIADVGMFGAATDAVENFFATVPVGQFIQDPVVQDTLALAQLAIDNNVPLGELDLPDTVSDITVDDALNELLGFDFAALGGSGILFTATGNGIFSLVDLVEAQLTAEISEVVNGLPFAFAVSSITAPAGFTAAFEAAVGESMFQAAAEVDFSIIDGTLVDFDNDGNTALTPGVQTALDIATLDCAVETVDDPVESDVCTIIDTSDGVHVLSVFENTSLLFATLDLSETFGSTALFAAPLSTTQNEAVEFSFASTALVERILTLAEDFSTVTENEPGTPDVNLSFEEAGFDAITDEQILAALAGIEEFFSTNQVFPSGNTLSFVNGDVADSDTAFALASNGVELFQILNEFQTAETLNGIIFENIPALDPNAGTAP